MKETKAEYQAFQCDSCVYTHPSPVEVARHEWMTHMPDRFRQIYGCNFYFFRDDREAKRLGYSLWERPEGSYWRGPGWYVLDSSLICVPADGKIREWLLMKQATEAAINALTTTLNCIPKEDS